MSVIEEIAAERHRQIEEEGWTAEHDDEHGNGEMAKAAAVYARHASTDRLHASGQEWKKANNAPVEWPWEPRWFKPKDRRRDLIRAGALIVAEIERLDRAAQNV